MKINLTFPNKKAPLHRGANLHGTTRFHKFIVFSVSTNNSVIKVINSELPDNSILRIINLELQINLSHFPLTQGCYQQSVHLTNLVLFFSKQLINIKICNSPLINLLKIQAHCSRMIFN